MQISNSCEAIIAIASVVKEKAGLIRGDRPAGEATRQDKPGNLFPPPSRLSHDSGKTWPCLV